MTVCRCENTTVRVYVPGRPLARAHDAGDLGHSPGRGDVLLLSLSILADYVYINVTLGAHPVPPSPEVVPLDE